MNDRLIKYVCLPYFILEGALNKLSVLQRALVVATFAGFFILLYFGRVVAAPGEYIFATRGDDLKNYYTLKTYIDQPVNKDILHYNSMNYPYSDIVYYSDNTPLLSIPLKWLSMHNIHLNPIVVFNYIIILNFLLASILCYLLLSRFISAHLLAIILSITLPYFEPQSLRIIEGTENLGLSFIILSNLLLLYIIYSRTEGGKSVWQYHVLNYLLIVAFSFVHLYYLLILCLNTGLVLFAYFLFKIKRKENFVRVLSGALLVPGLAFLTVLSIYFFSDEFYNARSEVAMGYNLQGWKTNVAGLYTSYPYLRIRFIFECTSYIGYEAHTYLGSFLLYGAVIFAFLWIFKKASLQTLKAYFRKPSSTFIILVLSASIVSLFIAIGPTYSIMNNEYRFNNFLDLFSFFRLFTKRVEHFRCLGRFSWLFFWSANFCFAYVFDNWLLSKKTIAVISLYVLSFLAFKDLSATGEEYRRNEFPNQFLRKNQTPDIGRLYNGLQGHHYNAILPLPFFLVGSEIHDRTMDPPTYEYPNSFFQLSSSAHLPLMSSMLSRTPIASNEGLFNFFLTSKMDSILKTKLTGKKIAVIISNRSYNTSAGFPVLDKDILRDAFYNSQKLPQQLQMTKVDSVGDYIFYEWQP